jgi:membrane fusion protein (multidrug efflux system)
LEQSIKTVEAELEVAKVFLDNTNLHLNRMKSLWEKPQGETPSIPKKLYDDAIFQDRESKATFAALEARVTEAKIRLKESYLALEQAQHALTYAKTKKEFSITKAPYDGIISRKMVSKGEAVSSAPVVHMLEIQEVNSLFLEFYLPQSLLGKIQGQKEPIEVEWEVEGICQKKGTISKIFPFLEESTRSFRCQIVVDNKDLKLKPSLLANVSVKIFEKKDAIVVSKQALVQGANNSWQVVVLEKEEQRPRVVKLGILTEDKAEIVQGLQENEKVLLPQK